MQIQAAAAFLLPCWTTAVVVTSVPLHYSVHAHLGLPYHLPHLNNQGLSPGFALSAGDAKHFLGQQVLWVALQGEGVLRVLALPGRVPFWTRGCLASATTNEV